MCVCVRWREGNVKEISTVSYCQGNPNLQRKKLQREMMDQSLEDNERLI